MRFQEYLNEKITRKEFDTVLDKNEVYCGCEFEFYFEAAGPSEHPDKDRIMDMIDRADDEANDAEKAIDDYQRELQDAEIEFDKKKEKKDDLTNELNELSDKENELERKIWDLENENNSEEEISDLEDEKDKISQEESRIRDEIDGLNDDLDEIDKFIDEGAWEKYADDMPNDLSMSTYDDVLRFFEDEIGADVYSDPATGRSYRDFNELALSWIEDQEVPGIQAQLNFNIEDVFDELEGKKEIIEEDLMREGFPFDLYEPGWKVEPDDSLGPNGIEVITPTIKINDLIDIIDEVFDWIDGVGYTDNSCGFHVHMSLDSADYELDPLKLIMFVEEGKIYEHFRERIGNRYAESIAKGHLSSISPFTVEELKKVAKKEKIEKNLNTEKMLGLHLIELEENHVEYRYMGDEDYHNKFKAVRNNIVNYAYWMSIACDPDFKKKEYIKKLQKMVDEYNRVFIFVSVSEFENKAKQNFKMHNRMTGISENKYKKLLDNYTNTYYKKVKGIPKPPDNIYTNIISSIETLIKSRVQQMQKEFTEKVKKAT